jgi:hypothetical protein
MTQISTHAPEQSSSFNNAVITILSVAMVVVAGLLAFAPFSV